MKNKEKKTQKWVETIMNVKNYPPYIWVLLAGVLALAYNFDFGIIIIVTGVFIGIYNRNKPEKNKKKKSFNKSMFTMNSKKVTYNGKVQEQKKKKK